MIERITGADLNGDGYIGYPNPEPVALPPLRVEVFEDEGRRAAFIDLPYPERLPKLAAGLAAGRQFAESTWTGRDGLFSRSEFGNLRGELIRRGLARWKNLDAPAQGVELTSPGKAVFQRLAGLGSPSLPGEK